MGLELFGKKLGGLASAAAKKAGEQMQITKLGIDKAGLEKELEEVYSALGRFCYQKISEQGEIPEGMAAYFENINRLKEQMNELEEQIEEHRRERDSSPEESAAQEGTQEDVLAVEPDVKTETAAAEDIKEEPKTEE